MRSYRAQALSTIEEAEQAGENYLLAGGDAIGAVVCGFFAAAGQHPGVLLGPVSILFYNLGSGARAFDGRLRQPGRGLSRARGFTVDQTVPNAARMAAPWGIAAALVAARYGRSFSLGRLVSPGVSIARRQHNERRAEVLSAVERMGAAALRDAWVSSALLRWGGRVEGGSLSIDDLEPGAGLDLPAQIFEQTATVPWLSGPSLAEAQASMAWEAQRVQQHAIVATDVSGGLAALAFDQCEDGLELSELGLIAPLRAQPTLRGEVRPTPGAALPSPAPISVLIGTDENSAGAARASLHDGALLEAHATGR